VSQPLSRKIALLSVAAVLLVVAVAWVWPGDNTALFSSPAKTAPTSTAEPPFQGWWDTRRQGEPYGTQVQGIITFRGNPTRTFYGTGPIPRTAPQELWRFPKSGGLCAISIDEQGPREWCGTGFTGQPAVFERDGKTWVVVGAYDKSLHFLDADCELRTDTCHCDVFAALASSEFSSACPTRTCGRMPPPSIWAARCDAKAKRCVLQSTAAP
jgi:hypothetical protein